MVASAPNAACVGEATEGDMGQMWVGVCFEIFPRQVRLRSPLVSHRPAIQLRSASEEARSNTRRAQGPTPAPGGGPARAMGPGDRHGALAGTRGRSSTVSDATLIVIAR